MRAVPVQTWWRIRPRVRIHHARPPRSLARSLARSPHPTLSRVPAVSLAMHREEDDMEEEEEEEDQRGHFTVPTATLATTVPGGSMTTTAAAAEEDQR